MVLAQMLTSLISVGGMMLAVISAGMCRDPELARMGLEEVMRLQVSA